MGGSQSTRKRLAEILQNWKKAICGKPAAGHQGAPKAVCDTPPCPGSKLTSHDLCHFLVTSPQPLDTLPASTLTEGRPGLNNLPRRK